MKPLRIVMWSGPRNLSTAMMRSFGARADTSVVDEPFYAAYLATTGIDHPTRDEIIANGETDWHRVAEACAREPVDPPIRYEKHMTHHVTEGVGLDWMRGAAIAFLIRDPRSVAASYAAKREDITAADVRVAPEAVLRKLCAALAIAWDPAMLSWPAAPQPSDGIWGKHWYAAVNASTSFAPPEGVPPVPPALIENVAAEARPHYERLARYRLLP